MTLLFIDSFDHYTTAEVEDKGYSRFFAGHSIEASVGRRGGSCMDSSGTALNGVLTKAIEPDSDGLVVGQALSISSYHDSFLFRIHDSGGTLVAWVEQTTAGELKLVSGGQTLTTAAAVFTPNSYNYYELKYLKGTGADSFAELRKDGVVLLTITTGDETAQASSFSPADSDGSFYGVLIDDLYCLNTEGTKNNDYLGDVRVDVHFTNADGSITNFNPNIASANFLLVDDVLPDGDTTFVESGSVSDKDKYSVDDATLGTVIHGVQQVLHNRKTDAGTIDITLITETPAGTGEKTTNNTLASDDYIYHLGILEKDPDDNTNWTDAKVNAAEYGYVITSITT